KDSVLYRLPYPEPGDRSREYDIRGTVASDHSVTVHVTVRDFSQWAAESGYERRSMKEEDQVKSWQKYLSEQIPGLLISDFHSGAATDSAWQSFVIHAPDYLLSTGSLVELKPDCVHLGAAPELVAETRQYPVSFGRPRKIDTHIEW